MDLKPDPEQEDAMKFFRFAIMFLFLGALLVGFTACGEEGPGERAGKALDEMVDDAKDELEEAKEKAEE